MRRFLQSIAASRGFALFPEILYGWAVVVAVVGIALYMGFSRVDPGIVKTAEGYLRALAGGNVAAAREVSVGGAADAASRLEGKDLAAQVVDMKVEVAAYSSSWARVLATVELALKDGSPDVGWYELELVKDGEAWKVYGLREVPPVVKGNVSGLPRWVRQLPLFGDSAGGKELREAEAVFRGYLDDLAAGRYKEAVRWLAGPALREHWAAGNVLAVGKLLGAVSEVSMVSLAEDGKALVVRYGYQVDGREARLVVTFYETRQGYRIISVSVSN